jgi:hypothetical protein
MPSTFLESSARLLVVLHAAAAIVLIGAASHHALICIATLRGRPRPRLMRIYAATAAVAYGVTFVLGALAYPTFRYHVRGLYLDRHEPWASNLFDIKENFASIGLPLVVGALVLSRVMDPGADRSMRLGYAVMVLGTAVIVWFNVVSGLFITLAKGV